MTRAVRMMHGLARMFCAAALALALAGCGTQPLALKPVDENQPIAHLNEPFEYTGKSFTHLWSARLATGDYRPIGKDARGVFYQGPPLCYSHRVLKEGPFAGADSRNFVMVADCALYLPISAAAPIRVLVLSGSARTILLNSPEEALPKIEEVNAASQQSVADPDKPVDTSQIVGTVLAMPAATSSIQGGIGAGIGTGILIAMIEAEQGRLNDAQIQPQGENLREVLQLREPDKPVEGAR